MLKDQAVIEEASEFSKLLDDSVLRYCEIAVPSMDGGHITSAFLFCDFRNIDWYWPMFNLAIFVGCKFVGCTFRGAVFAGCRFVDCTFEACSFRADNLEGECEFTNTVWYGCTQTGCTGLGTLVPAET